MSFSSEIDICNLALGWLGGKQITSLVDKSVESDLCNRNYSQARDVALEARVWTFAQSRASLNPTLPAPAFQYSYNFTLPADCLKVNKCSNRSDMKISEGYEWEKEGNMILTQDANCYIKYTIRIEDVTRYSATFIQAVAAMLAADIAIPLTNKPANMEAMLAKYREFTEVGGATDGQQGRTQIINSQRLRKVRNASAGGQF